MKLLVTGGAGYIGSVVAACLLDAGHDVVVLDDLLDRSPRGGAGRRRVRPRRGGRQRNRSCAGCRVRRGPALRRQVAGRRIRRSTGAVLVEQRGRLAAAASGHARRAVSSGSSSRPRRRPTACRRCRPSPRTPRRSRPTRTARPSSRSTTPSPGKRPPMGWPRSVLRYFNVGGSFAGLGERHDPETHLIPNILAVPAGRRHVGRRFRHGLPDPRRNRRSGLPARQRPGRRAPAGTGRRRTGEHRIYNLGTGTGYTVREVVQACRRVTGHPVPHVDRDRRPGDPPTLVASGEKAKAELGWEPRSGPRAGSSPTRGLSRAHERAWTASPRSGGASRTGYGRHRAGST